MAPHQGELQVQAPAGSVLLFDVSDDRRSQQPSDPPPRPLESVCHTNSGLSPPADTQRWCPPTGKAVAQDLHQPHRRPPHLHRRQVPTPPNISLGPSPFRPTDLFGGAGTCHGGSTSTAAARTLWNFGSRQTLCRRGPRCSVGGPLCAGRCTMRCRRRCSRSSATVRAPSPPPPPPVTSRHERTASGVASQGWIVSGGRTTRRRRTRSRAGPGRGSAPPTPPRRPAPRCDARQAKNSCYSNMAASINTVPFVRHVS